MKSTATTIKNTIKNKATSVVTWAREKKLQALMLVYAVLSPMGLTYGADAKWNAMISFILPWISRLGGVVLLIGAVEFGLAFKSDDAEGKTKGMRTAIAGCIVIAVGLSSSTFLY